MPTQQLITLFNKPLFNCKIKPVINNNNDASGIKKSVTPFSVKDSIYILEVLKFLEFYFLFIKIRNIKKVLKY